MSDSNVQLDQLIEFSNGKSKPNPSHIARYPIYGANGIIGFTDRSNAGPNVTIVGRVGSYCGAVHYSKEACWASDNAIIAKAKSGVNSRFIYYLLQALKLNEHHIGSGQPLLTQNILKKLESRMLHRSSQDAISETLGALDDKIAVNDRILATTDDMIRSFYAMLRKNLRNEIEISQIGTPVKDSVPIAQMGNSENYIGLEHMPRRLMWLSQWGISSEITSTKTRFRVGDVLFGKLRPYFHKIGLAPVDGVASTDILVIRPKGEHLRGWLLATLSSDEVVAHASAVADGTRMPRAKWSDLARFKVPWPGEQKAQEFDKFTTSIARKVENSISENRSLSQLRDALLPKLMSGEVRIRDAERVVEDAV